MRQQQGVQEVKISGDMDLVIGVGIGIGMLVAVLALKSKVRNGKKMRQKSEIYQEIQRRRK